MSLNWHYTEQKHCFCVPTIVDIQMYFFSAVTVKKSTFNSHLLL